MKDRDTRPRYGNDDGRGTAALSTVCAQHAADGGCHGDHNPAAGQERMAEERGSQKMVKRMALADKAGMEKVDKAKADRVIYEASKGSKFYEQEKIKDGRTMQRVGQLKKKVAMLKSQGMDTSPTLAKVVQSQVDHLERGRDLMRTHVHVDMDMFYAAVEVRDNPALKGVPVGVGGMGMLSTSNYEARKYGVRSAFI